MPLAQDEVGPESQDDDCQGEAHQDAKSWPTSPAAVPPTEIDPAQAHYFLLSGRDDFRGALANMCIRDSWTQFLFTMPSAVAVINALLAGVTVALALVTAVGTPLPLTVLAGMASGTTVLALHLAYQVRRFATMKANVAAVFPTVRSRPTLVRPTG